MTEGLTSAQLDEWAEESRACMGNFGFSEVAEKRIIKLIAEVRRLQSREIELADLLEESKSVLENGVKAYNELQCQVSTLEELIAKKDLVLEELKHIDRCPECNKENARNAFAKLLGSNEVKD